MSINGTFMNSHLMTQKDNVIIVYLFVLFIIFLLSYFIKQKCIDDVREECSELNDYNCAMHPLYNREKYALDCGTLNCHNHYYNSI